MVKVTSIAIEILPGNIKSVFPDKLKATVSQYSHVADGWSVSVLFSAYVLPIPLEPTCRQNN